MCAHGKSVRKQPLWQRKSSPRHHTPGATEMAAPQYSAAAQCVGDTRSLLSRSFLIGLQSRRAHQPPGEFARGKEYLWKSCRGFTAWETTAAATFEPS